ncbi:MAG: flavodoxin domain-containing protein [Bacillota bacterium]
MKTLIAYASKYGTTRDCANMLAEKFGADAAVIDLKTKPKTDLDVYDQIILGSPMYMGRIQKTVKNLCKDNHDLLLKKRIAFFVCGLSNKDEVRTYLQSQFSEDLLEHAAAIRHFGGEIRLENAKFMDKFILEKMQKEKNMQPTLDTSVIEEFYDILSRE